MQLQSDLIQVIYGKFIILQNKSIINSNQTFLFLPIHPGKSSLRTIIPRVNNKFQVKIQPDGI